MKVLIVFPHGNIFAPRRGNEVRVYNLVKQLARYNNEILTLELYEFMDNNMDKYKCAQLIHSDNKSIRRFFFNDYRVGRSFCDLVPTYLIKLYKIIKIEKPDIIQIEYPYGLFSAKIMTRIMSKLKSKLGKDIKKIKIIYDAHDVESERLAELLFKNRNYLGYDLNNNNLNLDSVIQYFARFIRYLYCSLIEKSSCKLVDHILTVSEKDRKILCNKYLIEPSKVTVIPSGTNIPDLSKFDKSKWKEKFGEDKIIIIFHGTFHYLPNKEAISLIKSFIAPRISEKYRTVLFIIAGYGVPKFNEKNIIGIGFVDNLYELIYAADIAICPILRGGGTRTKILDYMSVGVPIVTTIKGIEGIDAKNGRDAIIVDNVDERFIDAIEYLIENEDERKRLGKNARKLAEKNYDWNKIGKKLNTLYRRLAG